MIKLKQYRLVLIHVRAAAAGAPPDTLWRPGRSTDPSLRWSCTRPTPGRSGLSGRWSQTERGSWMGSQDGDAALCGVTR